MAFADIGEGCLFGIARGLRRIPSTVRHGLLWAVLDAAAIAEVRRQAWPDARSDDEVHAALAHIDDWRVAPGSAPRARDHQSTPALIAETAVAAVLMRLKTAPALLVVGTALSSPPLPVDFSALDADRVRR